MINGLNLCNSAYRQANIDQTLTGFDDQQEFPYNIALDILNTVIQDVNRQANYWFTQASFNILPVAQSYNLTTTGLDPKKLLRIRRELIGFQGDIIQVNWRVFQRHFRQGEIKTGLPKVWSKFGNVVEFDVAPDKDYQITAYCYQDIPLATELDFMIDMPDSDSDVLREGVYAYLLQRMGRNDFSTAFQLYQSKLKSLLANQKQDVGIGQRFPANF
jgi:hypothetical protein